jgi:hypothetical protein
MHLATRPGKRWDVTLTVQHGPFSGFVFYAVPPDDPSQTIEAVELFAETMKGRVEAVRIADASRFKKPLLKLELRAKAPCKVVAHVVLQRHNTSLVAGPPTAKAKPLGRLQHREFMDDGWPDESARKWFAEWMRAHDLMRGDEDEAAFAFRVLKFMQRYFRYVIPDDLPDHKAMVTKDPLMGDWHYTIQSRSGECLRLSDTYCRILRMNGLPARLVSGNFFGPESGHHLRSLVYLPEIGWVPVEATAAVSLPESPPLRFFGSWRGTMLIGNRNLGFELPGPKGSQGIGTMDQLAFAADDGTWEFPDAEIVGRVLPSSESSPAR